MSVCRVCVAMMSLVMVPVIMAVVMVVFRVVDGKKMAAVFDLKQIRAGDAVDPQIYGDDIVVVDQSGGKTALKTITDSLRGIVGFRTF
mgnify:CR=1 FL=1